MALVSSADIVLAPCVSGTSGVGSRVQQTLAGSTSQSSTELETGTWATIKNGSAAITVRFTSTASTAVSTDLPLGPYDRLDWYVDDDSKFVAALGTSFTCTVWTSSVRGA